MLARACPHADLSSAIAAANAAYAARFRAASEHSPGLSNAPPQPARTPAEASAAAAALLKQNP